MQQSLNQQNNYTCLYSRQSAERDCSAQNKDQSRPLSQYPQQSSESVLSDALCLELSGKTCDEAEKAKMDRIYRKRYSSTEDIMRNAQMNNMQKGKDCCTSYNGPPECCDPYSGEKCKEEVSQTLSQKNLHINLNPNTIGDTMEETQNMQQLESSNRRPYQHKMKRWNWGCLTPHATESFVDLRRIDNRGKETNCSNQFREPPRRPPMQCDCSCCKYNSNEYANDQDENLDECQCPTCVQERLQQFRLKTIREAKSFHRDRFEQSCCCSCCLGSVYENPCCCNNNQPYSTQATQTADLPNFNIKDYQCNCEDCTRKRQNKCDCYNSESESYLSNYIDLPYQTTDDYMDLIEELEEKLLTRNRNRVRKTMMEFEIKSRQNKPLEKPIVNHDEISEGDEPILENLSEIKRRKQKPCSVHSKMEYNCPQPPQPPPCYANRGNSRQGSRNDSYQEFMPHSPLRFKWKMNRFGEWKKISKNEQTCDCNRCNCGRIINCRKTENFGV